jgi:ABC-type Mn2+/Zn2+ transport system ATPase subunit
MKILKEYPKTVAQIVEEIAKLPRELDLIICLNMYEIAKNLPEDMLKSQNLMKNTYPVIFINKFSLNDHRLKTLCRKAHSYLTEHIPGLVESS